MKILLDECLPLRLAKFLLGHDVRTVRQMNWLGLSKGRLLDVAGEFDLFIIVDKNIVNQSQLTARRLSVIVLRVQSNTIENISPLVPQLINLLAELKPGTVTVVS